MPWLAIDIGGANLKIADGEGFADVYAFPLWQRSNQLAQELRTLLVEAPPCDRLAVTMTGELADCFETKQAGVRFIINAVTEAAAGRHTRVYLTDGKLVAPQTAANKPALAAAANWHALATFATRFAPQQSALLVDIGSTTVDIVPLSDGRVIAVGQNDTDRLLAGELVYTGVERSPVCAVARQVTYRGQQCPLAQELFATMRDVYVLLQELPESDRDHDTADGRPATKPAARARLGRMICADHTQFNHHDAVIMANEIAAAHVESIKAALCKVLACMAVLPEVIVLSGHGDFLLRRIVAGTGLKATGLSLSRKLGPTVARCATAHALAVLAREMSGQG